MLRFKKQSILQIMLRLHLVWVLTMSAALIIGAADPEVAQSPRVVISQIYGGGGNSGAPYRQDFIELFNRGSEPVDLAGWSVQYAPAAGATWSRAALAGTIAPGGYFLVQGIAGGNNGLPLPSPDAITSLALAASAGKVALVQMGAALAGACPAEPRLIDLVGYGAGANCFEGTAPAPAPSATRVALRRDEGCADAGDNLADFTAAPPAPRNTSAPVHRCDTGAEADPGEAWPERSEAGAGRAGAVLVYPLYASRASAPALENTRFSITNASGAREVVVHLYFVAGDGAGTADAFIHLTPNQTQAFLATDLDPHVSGFLIAVAVDAQTGCPVKFNHLIGDARVKLASGHAAGLGAIAFAAIADNPSACAPGAMTTELRFDGEHYSAAARVLASSHLASPAWPSSLLVIDRLGGDLATGGAAIGRVTGTLFDDLERSASFTFHAGVRQLRVMLSSSFPRTAPRTIELIPAERAGWLKLWAADDAALVGALLRREEAAGRLLHHLALTPTAVLTVPISTPPN
jgi:hypothetical protein